MQPGNLIVGRALLSPLGWLVFLVVGALLLIGVPYANTALPPSSPYHVPDLWIPLLGKYLCFALLALSLDLIWGYAGILSLGHGAFFALGGYAFGMHLMREIGDRGVYGNPELPDFMVFLNWQELPWYWWGFDSFLFACVMVLLVPGLLAFVFGWFAFRSRITGVYFSIITQALTYALMLAFFRNDMGFGGNNGLTDFKDVLGYSLQTDSTRRGLYVLTVIALGLCFLLGRLIVTSKLGRLLLAVRDAESRVRFLGYNVTALKLSVWVVSAMMAGVAGALYVPQVGIINPSEFSPVNSIEVAVWVAAGGRGTLAGPILGAVGINYAETYFTGAAPEFWLLILGSIFIAVTLFFPRGVIGLFGQLRTARDRMADNKQAAYEAALQRIRYG